eukprot:scaffold654281_cov37-Prasinocladus_malaysianus.AAC.1
MSQSMMAGGGAGMVASMPMQQPQQYQQQTPVMLQPQMGGMMGGMDPYGSGGQLSFMQSSGPMGHLGIPPPRPPYMR